MTKQPLPPAVHVTYFVEIYSSWCYWVEPTWKALQQGFAGRVGFDWKIALMPSSAFPVSRAQCDWFYRRSGTIVRSPFMLNSGWFRTQDTDYSVPNRVAEAARVLGATGDTVRLALAEAALRAGRDLSDWDESVAVAASASGLSPEALRQQAQGVAVAGRVAASTEEFHSLKINQRPAFLVESAIGDRAVLSGTVALEPLVAVIEAQLADAAAYAAHRAHWGEAPTAAATD